ncbi:FAD-dependent oxidoreductase [Ktedonobacter sp. SOSP1-85]|uniref:phytoene desaturase family protein n=1 Tax=Ktedonobacter sp. SOSP1-85 TaxID=2778367 RepID=UPI001915206A|nr:NAD(P)/FAD-dependent oxidoreductase [Ktedonobacter sp. SOSP1-85]GHO79493.1 FAD-dependent oxidoreductase [Ktedonobacter sp. SOSP1-85]
MAEYDAVIVGSGINSLVAAAFLAKAGWHVCILEKNSWLGGAIQTAEITEPGFHHDVFSGWHPLFAGSEAYRLLRNDLEARGLEYLKTDLAAATLYPNGVSPFLYTSHDRNVQEMERIAPGDGEAWDHFVKDFTRRADLIFSLLGTELWSPAGLGYALQAYRRMKTRGLLEFTHTVLSTCRQWVEETFTSSVHQGLFAPWVLHTGLGPEDAASGIMTQTIAYSLEAGGVPVPRGGSARLVDALVQLIRDYGGTCETGQEVEKILVSQRQATGVRLVNGETMLARRAVICNVTPSQLYLRLLDETALPPGIRLAARRFRYGRAAMQIHMALSELPRWNGVPQLLHTPLIHITPGLNGVSRAVNEAERGLLPAEATIVCGQPLSIDSSRAPAGRWILWLQLQELPTHPQGDANNEVDVGNGAWTEDLRERYADRIQAVLERHIANLRSSLLRRVVLSPADLEQANSNLVGGDPYSGSCQIDQSYLWRPLPNHPSHETPIHKLYQIGASTYPGPGLGAGSGTIVARALLQQPWPQRVLHLFPFMQKSVFVK